MGQGGGESWGEPADHWQAGRLAGMCREPGGTDGVENMVSGEQITTGSGVNLSRIDEYFQGHLWETSCLSSLC